MFFSLKYRIFSNVYDFIYQVYQIGVNNYSNNTLFKTYALEDLAHILKVKIFLFDIKSTSVSSIDDLVAASSTHPTEKTENLDVNSAKTACLKIYEPEKTLTNGATSSISINDFVYLSMSKNSKVKYKFLLPKLMQPIINDTLLSPQNRNVYYMQTKATYSNYLLLLSRSELNKCFSHKELCSNVNLILFLKFLSESSVHTLISLNDLKFDAVIYSSDHDKTVRFFNDIWGQNHFDLKEILAEIEVTNNKKVLKYSKSLHLDFFCCWYIHIYTGKVII